MAELNRRLMVFHHLTLIEQAARASRELYARAIELNAMAASASGLVASSDVAPAVLARLGQNGGGRRVVSQKEALQREAGEALSVHGQEMRNLCLLAVRLGTALGIVGNGDGGGEPEPANFPP